MVTGASGFIGFHTLLPLLKRGFEVHGLTHSHTKNLPGITWHHADLTKVATQVELVKSIRPTHLLHMAWYVTPGKYTEAPENETWLQVSLELFNTFLKHGGQRVATAGSCFEYDWTTALTGPLQCSEDKTPIKPLSFYGQCKNKLHQGLSALSLPLGYAWGRIFYLYGIGEAPSRLVPALIRAMKNDTALAVWAPRLIRDYMYVKDVGDAFAATLDSDYKGAVNIASGRPMLLGDFVQALAPLLQKAATVKAEIVNPPLGPSSPLELTADTAILNSKIGWRPSYDLTAGLQEMI